MNSSVMTGVMSCMRATGRERVPQRSVGRCLQHTEDEGHNEKHMIIHYHETYIGDEWSWQYDGMK